MTHIISSMHPAATPNRRSIDFVNGQDVRTQLDFTFRSKMQNIFLTHANWRYLLEGTHGYIFQATKMKTGQKLAVKVSKKKYKKTVLKEYLTSQGIKQNPHVIRSFDFFQSSKHVFYTLELCYCDLRTILDNNRQGLGYRNTLKIMLGAAKGIAAMHESGVVHCDAKPENILISYDNLVKIADFSSAKYINSEVFFTVQGGRKVQTSWYRAPEREFVNFMHSIGYSFGIERLKAIFREVQAMGYFKPAEQQGDYLCHKKIDVWSLGCDFYELVTGKVLFEAKEEECFEKLLSIWALLKEKDSILVDEPDEKKKSLDSIIKRCLDFNVNQRISISKLKKDLTKRLKEKYPNKIKEIQNRESLKSSVDQLIRLIQEATGIPLSSAIIQAILAYLPKASARHNL